MKPRAAPKSVAGTVRDRRSGTSSFGNELRKLLRGAPGLAALFKLLGHADRLRILTYLRQGARTVGEIDAALDIRQPALSQQLSKLRENELIVGRRVLKSVSYELTAEGARLAQGILDALSGTGSAAALDPTVRVEPAAPVKPRHSFPAAMFAVIHGLEDGLQARRLNQRG
jgi:DNA-binding transcriptional ArsR family regulator